jgi:hypothetical protein
MARGRDGRSRPAPAADGPPNERRINGGLRLGEHRRCPHRGYRTREAARPTRAAALAPHAPATASTRSLWRSVSRRQSSAPAKTSPLARPPRGYSFPISESALHSLDRNQARSGLRRKNSEPSVAIDDSRPPDFNAAIVAPEVAAQRTGDRRVLHMPGFHFAQTTPHHGDNTRC